MDPAALPGLIQLSFGGLGALIGLGSLAAAARQPADRLDAASLHSHRRADRGHRVARGALPFCRAERWPAGALLLGLQPPLDQQVTGKGGKHEDRRQTDEGHRDDPGVRRLGVEHPQRDRHRQERDHDHDEEDGHTQPIPGADHRHRQAPGDRSEREGRDASEDVEVPAGPGQLRRSDAFGDSLAEQIGISGPLSAGVARGRCRTPGPMSSAPGAPSRGQLPRQTPMPFAR
jgi:hypothetical protein